MLSITLFDSLKFVCTNRILIRTYTIVFSSIKMLYIAPFYSLKFGSFDCTFDRVVFSCSLHDAYCGTLPFLSAVNFFLGNVFMCLNF
jgi:hypothetical protein